MKTKSITQKRVKELLSYDPNTGEFTWIVGRSGTKGKGSVAGKHNQEGYRSLKIDGVTILSHRLAWLYINGSLPNGQIDHINRIKDDNRIINLREASCSENAQNKLNPNANNKIGMLGVSEIKGRFRAKIKINNIGIHLGYFSNANDAHIEYLAAKKDVHPFAPKKEAN